MSAVREHGSWLSEVAAAQIFQHDGKKIRQLASRQFEPRLFVKLFEFDHGLAPIAAFAVQMLEQMQRQSPSAVEQIDIAFLSRQEIALAEFFDQVEKAALLNRRHNWRGADGVGDRGQR